MRGAASFGGVDDVPVVLEVDLRGVPEPLEDLGDGPAVDVLSALSFWLLFFTAWGVAIGAILTIGWLAMEVPE